MDYLARPIDRRTPVDVWIALLAASDDGFLEWFGGYLDRDFGDFRTRELYDRRWCVVGWRHVEALYRQDLAFDAGDSRNWRYTLPLRVGPEKRLGIIEARQWRTIGGR